MSTSPPGSTATEPDPAQRRLRWPHCLLFFLPAMVCVGTTWMLAEMARAKDAASGFTYLSDYGRQTILFGPGLMGLTAGAVCCAVSAVCIGFTSKARQPVLSSLGWAVLCVLVNITIAYAGCSFLEGRFRQ